MPQAAHFCTIQDKLCSSAWTACGLPVQGRGWECMMACGMQVHAAPRPQLAQASSVRQAERPRAHLGLCTAARGACAARRGLPAGAAAGVPLPSGA